MQFLLFLCSMNISVVIITKNEAHIIANTLESLKAITDDIVIVDSGSTDDTIVICKKMNAHVIETGWAGYGINKNLGIKAAKNDWILSLDADEAIDGELQQSLLQLTLANDEEVFDIRFKNFFCNKWIRFGEWGFDWHIRLFNRTKVHWNNVAGQTPSHEVGPLALAPLSIPTSAPERTWLSARNSHNAQRGQQRGHIY